MSSTFVLYLIAGIGSIVIAFLLVRVARLSGQAKIKPLSAAQDSPQIVRESAPVPSLEEAVGQQFAQLGQTDPEAAQEASKKLLASFNQELEQRIQEAQTQIHHKYESLINEKTRDQEQVWKKFNEAVAEKQQTDAVIRSISDGLVVVGPDGKVLMMNPAAEKMLGVSRKDKVGKPLSNGIKGEQLVSLVKTSSEGKDKEIELVSSDEATTRVLRASSAVVENEQGQTVGMVSVLSDITKQRELDNLKTGFVASVSHELRTPLVAIEKSLSLLLSRVPGPLLESQEQFLQIAQRNLKRLSRLIDDLLDLSKLEAGGVELSRRPVPVHLLIDEAVETILSWAQSKSHTIERSIEPNLPPVNVDQERMAQVLQNLLGNAVKFTPNGGVIKVEARLRRDENCIAVTVADNGIGITPEHLPRIFEKFHTFREEGNTDISGTRIGLSIVKELVELHGGTIDVESDKGRGTRFTFTIPLSAG